MILISDHDLQSTVGMLAFWMICFAFVAARKNKGGE